MPSVDFETAVKQEEAYLRQVHPKVEDIPTCLSLFDEYLRCHGERGRYLSSQWCSISGSYREATQVSV
jgi:hypothetical protein